MECSPVDFDIDDFLSRISGNKPPFTCPVDNCSAVCKSLSSMHTHMGKHRPQAPLDAHDDEEMASEGTHSEDLSHSDKELNNNEENDDQVVSIVRKKSSNRRINVSFSGHEEQKYVLFEARGRNYRCNINVPMEICESTLPFSVKEDTSKPDHCNGTSCSLFNGDHKNSPKIERKPGGVIKSLSIRPINGTRPLKRGPQKSKPSFNKSIAAQSVSDNGNSEITKATVEVPIPKPVFEIKTDFPMLKKSLIHDKDSFVRFIDKSQEELEDTIEYDLDEEDLIWLERINSTRTANHLPPISQTILEGVLDRLEKAAHFRSSGGVDSLENVDEDAVCAVCLDGSCDNANAILFCDVCNLAVHQECYGVPYIPEGQWLCRKCIYSPSHPVACCLCPNTGGAFKRTDTDNWAHVVCALWIPEVMFANLTFLEPIEHIDKISQARRRLQCYICKQRNVGACIQCHKSSCYTAFHVTCAQQAGLYMRIEKSSEASHGGVKKNAFCDIHAPPDTTKLNGSMYAHSDQEEDPANRHEAQKLYLKRARKILATRRNCKPTVCVPVVPTNKLQKIMSSVEIEERDEFSARVHAFWTLKREVRNGVPLLKRLQASSNRGTISFFACDEESKRLRGQMKFWQRLRHDLERARLLSELTRKREKIKRDWFRIHAMTIELEIQPFACFLRRIVHRLQDRDADKMFSEVVTDDKVPGYSAVVKNPMAFSMMLDKIEENVYMTVGQLEEDFQLMIDNCCLFNPKTSVYHKSALKLKQYGVGVFQAAREQASAIKFDEASGLHLDDISKYLQREADKSTEKVYLEANELESISKRDRKNLTPARQLNFLVTKLETVIKERLHAAPSKSSDTTEQHKTPTQEISKLRREIKTLRSRYKLSVKSKTVLPFLTSPPHKSASGDSPMTKLGLGEVEEDSETTAMIGSSQQSSNSKSSSMETTAMNSSSPMRLFAGDRHGGTFEKPVLPKRRPGRPPGSGVKKMALMALHNATATHKRGQLKLWEAIKKSPVKKHGEQDTEKATGSEVGDKETTRKPTRRRSSLLNETNESIRQDATSEKTQEKPAEEIPSKEPGLSNIIPKRKRGRPSFRSLSSLPDAKCPRLQSTSKSPARSSTDTSVTSCRRVSRTLSSSSSSTLARPPTLPFTGGRLFSPDTGDEEDMPLALLAAAGRGEPQAAVEQNPAFTRYRSVRGEEEEEEVVRGGKTRTSSSSLTNSKTTSTKAKTGLSPKKVTKDLSPPAPPCDMTQRRLSRPPRMRRRFSMETSVCSEASSEAGSDLVTSCSSIRSDPEASRDPPVVRTRESEEEEVDLEPLDLVWAQSEAGAWWPGLLIDPSMPRDGLSHNGVSISAPPADALKECGDEEEGRLLVHVFDEQETWRWVPRELLEPLGVDAGMDRSMLRGVDKTSTKAAIRKAYARAVEHLCKVNGRPFNFPGISSSQNITSR